MRASVGRARYLGVVVALAVAACGGGDDGGREPAQPVGDPAAGRQLFLAAQPSCASCHVLADAGARGTLGPNLDQLRPNAARVAAILASGSPPMPSYAGRFDAGQIADLAAYVESASR